MINKIIYTFIITALCAQIQHPGLPKFYQNRSEDINYIGVDFQKEVYRDFHPMVFQFGSEYELDLNILEESRVIEDGNELTFIVGVHSPGAYGIGLNFNQFYLSPNAKLFFYDEDRTFKLGALNANNNKSSNILATSIIKGDRIVIELTVPYDEVDIVKLELESIIHDYTDIMNYYDNSNSDREDCNTNVNCSEGDDWRDQINGVVRVAMGGGSCSASIVNNTSNDRTPYVLFADHCVSGNASGYVFYFNYQSSTCNGTTGSLNQSVSGSTLLASQDLNSGPDFALLELTSNIPDSYDPFYVGWSRSSAAPQEAIGIHHPGADIKKISFTNDNVSANGDFWEFQYDVGRVIPGSSGSPFFDQNKRQVGIASFIYTNYCDPSPDCYCAQQYNHGYGRFDQAWDLGMAQYLDPINSGATAIDGIGNTGINITHSNIQDMPYEGDAITFIANITSYSGTIEAAQLNYDIGDGWTTLEMNQNFGTNTYETSLTNLYDGMIVKYYIMAIDSDGIVQSYPNNAPNDYIMFILGDLPDFYANNFESDTEGWVIGDESDNATSGVWELGSPIATFNDQGSQIQPGVDSTEEGEYCFITGNGNEDGNGGYDDVDGGNTTLYSPTFNLENFEEVIVSYSRWYTNNIGDNGDNDKWEVSVSRDGTSWVNLEYTSSSYTAWVNQSFLLSDYIDFSETITFKFIAEDIFYNGDDGSGGSLVEAAIDDFKIEFLYQGSGIEGDVNNDLLVNVLDAVVLINMILGLEPLDYAQADLNSDGQINVQDIVLVVNIILQN